MVCYLKDVKSDLQLRSLDSGDVLFLTYQWLYIHICKPLLLIAGTLVQKIALPGLGSVNGFSSKREDSECLFSFTGFTDPGSIWRCLLWGPLSILLKLLYIQSSCSSNLKSNYKSIQSPISTTSGLRLDVAEGKREPKLFRKTHLKGGVQAGDFETRQLFAISKDGTRVPMFVVGKKGFALDGSNPTLLYGYGGA